MRSVFRGAPANPFPTARGVAQGLGVFSIALGVLELLAPRRLAQWLGLRSDPRMVQAYGVREVATGLAILGRSRDPAPFVWARVAGDALDLATLAAMAGGSRARGRLGLAVAAVIGVTVLDALCAQSLSTRRRHRTPVRDYSDRSGLPDTPERMRGAARVTVPIREVGHG
ncbi:cyclase dehydrase [Inquilinus limosus]|uniref:cyclase dehydrase n=1 Tax=Inquilinus limosus TaxID=171674 RepID=UPI003F139497